LQHASQIMKKAAGWQQQKSFIEKFEKSEL
jgi:hypothetical protein